MLLKGTDFKTKIEGGVIYRKDEFELGCYKVFRITHLKNNKITYKDFSVYTDDKYAPTIQYEDNWWSDEKPSFKIQTTAYGALDADEIKKIISGYQEAVEAVELLTKNFC